MMAKLAERMGISDPKTLYRLYYFLRRDNVGFRKIEALLKDPMIEDISCDGPGIPIFIYHRRYYNMETNIQFEKEELDPLQRPAGGAQREAPLLRGAGGGRQASGRGQGPGDLRGRRSPPGVPPSPSGSGWGGSSPPWTS